jgi:flagellar biosynthesis/type III secretory pathway protein FliH
MNSVWALLQAIPQVISLVKAIISFLAKIKEEQEKAKRAAQDKIDQDNLEKYKETIKDGKTQSEIDDATSKFLNGN